MCIRIFLASCVMPPFLEPMVLHQCHDWGDWEDVNGSPLIYIAVVRTQLSCWVYSR